MYDIAVKAIVLRENKILILHKTPKEKQSDIDKNCYDLPGGRIEVNEKLDDALTREVREETGLELRSLEIHDATLIENKSGVKIVMLYYLCHCSGNRVTLSEEHDGFYWRTKDKILSDKEIPDWIKLLISKIVQK
jgi:8-oxo-dGTP diphosphatase